MSIALHRHTRPLAFQGATRTRGTPGGGEGGARGESAPGIAGDEAAGGAGAASGAPAPRPWLAPSGGGARPDGTPEGAAGGETPSADGGESTARAPGGESSAAGGAAADGTAGSAAAAERPGAADGGADEAALAPVLAEVKGKLAGLANDPEAFHGALTKAFGDRYDKASAETIRQQVLAGDFSWLPNIEVVDGATLGDTSGTQGPGQGLGAYSAETDTVYISRELLAEDPAKAASILTEEIGHGLDARLNVTDSAGDEGAIFSALVDGKSLSDTELSALQSENDSGTIIVDGKEVEVEYGWGNPFKKAKKALKKVVKKAKDVVSSVGNAIAKPFEKVVELGKDIVELHKKAFKKILQSEVLGTIMAIAQYVPIPIVAAVATVYNTVRAGYAVYRGIKDKSFATVLGGVAGLAGGAAKLGGAFGASEKFIKGAATISQRANQASRLYSLRGDVSFRNAASIGADLFGGTKAGSYFKAADRGFSAYDAARSGDPLGALAIGSDALRELPGTRYDAALGRIGDHALTGRSIVAAARDKDYASVVETVNREYGARLGLDDKTRGHIDDFVGVVRTADRAVSLADDGKDYFGAAELLFGEAAERFDSPVVSGRFREGAEIFDKLGTLESAVDGERLGEASDLALELLGRPLDETTSARLLDVLQSVDVLRGTSSDTGGENASPLLRAAGFGRGAYEASKRGDDLGALAFGAEAFRSLPGTRFDAALGDVGRTALDGRAVVALAREGRSTEAVSLANELFGARLGLGEIGRGRVDDLVRVVDLAERASALGDEKDYFGAAEVLFEGVAGLDAVSPTVRARFEGGAGIFDRLGTIDTDIDEGRLETATVRTLSLLGEPLDARTRGQVLELLGSVDVLRGTAEVGDEATPLRRAAGFGRAAYEAREGGDALGAAAFTADALRELPGTRFDATLGTLGAGARAGADLVDRVDAIRDDVRAERLESATADTLALLGEPLDAGTREQLLGLLGVIDELRGTRVDDRTSAPAGAAA